MEKGDIPAQTYTYDVMADRLKQTITIGLPAKTITVTLTDKPLAPQVEEAPAEEAGGATAPTEAETNAESAGQEE